MKSANNPTLPSPGDDAAPTVLIADIRRMIEETRTSVATAVNAGLTILYWRIGKRIHEDILQGNRAEYGEQIVRSVAQELEREYGRGFSEKNLHHLIRFADAFPDGEIVYALSRQLSWTHFRSLIYLDDPRKREFYAEMCRLERWSTRVLQQRVDSMLYERTALSRQPDALIRQELAALKDEDHVSAALIFKDPYILDFLGLRDRYLEKDLEDAILREMEHFLLELGAGFTFVSRQKRLQIDNDDFYIDLLFYNRKLRRLIAIDLKLGDFRPEHKGQMELYLRWLAKFEREPGEGLPLGIILCTGKKQQQIELLELGKTGIHVAEYLTDLPAKEVLERKLREVIAVSRARLESDGEDQ